MRKPLFILANAKSFPPQKLKTLLTKNDFIALDGAADFCYRAHLIPNLILGDLDSAGAKSLAYFKKLGVPILHLPSQDKGDLEKALTWCLQKKYYNLEILDAWGSRIDHNFLLFSLLSKFHSKLKMIAHTETCTIHFLRNQNTVLTGRSKRQFAVLPFPKCKVWSKGLDYEMTAQTLKIGGLVSSSNRAPHRQVKLKVMGQAIIVEEK